MASKLPKRTLDRARHASELLFGAKHRLPMALVVAAAEEQDLYAAALAPRADTTEVQAGTELRLLARAGLLQLQPEPPRAPGRRGRPPKRYTRRESAFWSLAEELARTIPPAR